MSINGLPQNTDEYLESQMDVWCDAAAAASKTVVLVSDRHYANVTAYMNFRSIQNVGPPGAGIGDDLWWPWTYSGVQYTLKRQPNQPAFE